MSLHFGDADYLIRCAIKTLIVIFQFHEIPSPYVLDAIKREGCNLKEEAAEGEFSLL